MKEIEWYENDGCLGGIRGLKFNLETNTITKWNGNTEVLSDENIEEVIYCIDMNIIKKKNRIDFLNRKLNQTEIERIKIEFGHKISEPLSNEQTIKYLAELNKLKLELDMYKILKNNYINYES